MSNGGSLRRVPRRETRVGRVVEDMIERLIPAILSYENLDRESRSISEFIHARINEAVFVPNRIVHSIALPAPSLGLCASSHERLETLELGVAESVAQATA